MAVCAAANVDAKSIMPVSLFHGLPPDGMILPRETPKPTNKPSSQHPKRGAFGRDPEDTRSSDSCCCHATGRHFYIEEHADSVEGIAESKALHAGVVLLRITAQRATTDIRSEVRVIQRIHDRQNVRCSQATSPKPGAGSSRKAYNLYQMPTASRISPMNHPSLCNS